MKVKQEKQGKGSKERPGDGCPWDEGEIQGRSIDLRGFGVQGCRRKYRKRGRGGKVFGVESKVRG